LNIFKELVVAPEFPDKIQIENGEIFVCVRKEVLTILKVTLFWCLFKFKLTKKVGEFGTHQIIHTDLNLSIDPFL